MATLRIEHPVPSFEGWRAVFDADPVNREASGVRRYQISRPIEDSGYVMIDLDFDTTDDAEAFLAKLRAMWAQVEGTIMTNPQARIVEVIETKEY